jgi:hypothetical protein
MAKHVIWIGSAVLLIALGTTFYVASSHTLLAIYPDVRLFSAVLLLVVAVVLRRRAEVAARLLMLFGSASLVAAYLHDFFIEFGMRHHWFQVGGEGWVFYGYMEARENPLWAIPSDILRILGFCFPLGMLLLALQREPKPSNQA